MSKSSAPGAARTRLPGNDLLHDILYLATRLAPDDAVAQKVQRLHEHLERRCDVVELSDLGPRLDVLLVDPLIVSGAEAGLSAQILVAPLRPPHCVHVGNLAGILIKVVFRWSVHTRRG